MADKILALPFIWSRALILFTPALLLTVFATHLPFFLWRYAKTGERRHLATSLTFALLSVSYSFQVFAPDAVCAGVRCAELFRVPAWIAAAFSITLLVLYWSKRRRSRSAQ